MSMTVAKLALNPRQIGENAPARELRIAGVRTDFTRVAAGFLKEGGGVMEIEVASPADTGGSEGLPVEFDIGYGKGRYRQLLNYFSGVIESVDEAGNAVCYGPLKTLGEQKLLRQVNYGGWYLEDALYDLAYNPAFGTPIARGALEVRAGRSYLVGTTPPIGGGAGATDTGAIFPLETTRQEVAEALTGAAGYYLGERPNGRVLAMPTPKPGATGKAKAVYTEDHYTAFRPTGTRKNLYASVLVFRRNEGGLGYGAWAMVPVENAGRVKPSANRVYMIPEFPGTDAEAEQVASDTSRLLAHGQVQATIEGLAADPTILMHDAVDVHRTKHEGASRDRYAEVWSCQVDTEHSVEATRETQDMTLSVSAMLVGRKLVPVAVFFPSDVVSPALVEQGVRVVLGLKPAAGLKPAVGLKPRTTTQERTYS